ncbi:phage portal protein [Caloramator sp. Dgby_cultured_2]|uniref:phage portal protein n=1 Tax=Caloramator sp. Dgby_cultured_2 TaxID=3029174 RepID=UPI00237EC39D|nr:phage portal protein [Caloramator sp. Dgby_cultured_2]WDU82285.1 phage portal protein [Caloramator sp. Dgby_cultured_2]
MLTSLNQIDIGQPWPVESEIERLRRYEANKNLFEGYHDLVFGDWVRRLYRDEYDTAVFIVTNWAKRLSTLWADLLLGERPRITAGEQKSKEQQQLEKIINDNDFFNVAYEVALDISRYGTGIFKVRYDKRPIIEAVPPSLWFPVVSPDNIKDVQAHVIAWTFEITEKTLFGGREKEYF